MNFDFSAAAGAPFDAAMAAKFARDGLPCACGTRRLSRRRVEADGPTWADRAPPCTEGPRHVRASAKAGRLPAPDCFPAVQNPSCFLGGVHA